MSGNGCVIPEVSTRILFFPNVFRAGEVVRVRVSIENFSSSIFSSNAEAPFLASYHWCDENSIVIWDGLRTPFSCDVNPGASIELDLLVKAPENSGNLLLSIDVVQEGRFWLSSSSYSKIGVTEIFIEPTGLIDTHHDRKDLLDWELEHFRMVDLSEADVEIIRAVRPFTMTTPVRIAALLSAIRHVQKNNIPGDFVECGVWRGGSAMAMALQLQRDFDSIRRLYLYDTFSGMPEPRKMDVNFLNQPANTIYDELRISDELCEWAYATQADVVKNMETTGFPLQRCEFVKGRIEQSTEKTMPKFVAILRLDTDWYESTRHELISFMPRVSRGGVVIIDDYGHWKGSKLAVDEYFDSLEVKPFLHRIDYAARMWIVA